MYKNLFFRLIVVWHLFIPIAIANGIIRETLYEPIVGDLTAHQISTVTASIAFLTLAYFMLRNIVIKIRNAQLLVVGLLWVFMTVAFEFGFGHYIDGVSWEKLFAGYNILQGHVWVLFLLVVFFTPNIIKLITNKEVIT